MCENVILIRISDCLLVIISDNTVVHLKSVNIFLQCCWVTISSSHLNVAVVLIGTNSFFFCLTIYLSELDSPQVIYLEGSRKHFVGANRGHEASGITAAVTHSRFDINAMC